MKWENTYDTIKYSIVTLSARVWIEMLMSISDEVAEKVTLSARVWIEITKALVSMEGNPCHPQCEGVD